MIQEIQPYRKKRLRPSSNKRVLVIIILFFILFASVLYLESPLGRIDTIEVTGYQWLSEEEVVRESGLSPGLPVLQFRPRRIKERLLALPETKAVNIRYQFPNHVKIHLEEWRQVAQVQEVGSAPAVLLENGEVLYALRRPDAPAASSLEMAYVQQAYSQNKMKANEPGEGGANKALPIVLGPVEEDERLIILAAELVQLSDVLFQSIETIRFLSDEPWQKGEVVLSMNEGYQVQTTLYEMAEKIQDYPEIAAYLKGDGKPGGVLHMVEAPWYEPFDRDDEKIEVLAEEAE